MWFNAWVIHKVLGALGAFLGKSSAMKIPFPMGPGGHTRSAPSPKVQVWFWGYTRRFVPVPGSPNPPRVLSIRNGLVSPGVCPFIQRTSAAKVDPQILGNKELVVFLCECHGGINLAPPKVR